MKDEITREERVDNLKGMGCSRKRVEDARFTQGKGNYVDDIKLDGMLFGDFVRSPYAHARVKNTGLALHTPRDLSPSFLFAACRSSGAVAGVLPQPALKRASLAS